MYILFLPFSYRTTSSLKKPFNASVVPALSQSYRRYDQGNAWKRGRLFSHTILHPTLNRILKKRRIESLHPMLECKGDGKDRPLPRRLHKTWWKKRRLWRRSRKKKKLQLCYQIEFLIFCEDFSLRSFSLILKELSIFRNSNCDSIVKSLFGLIFCNSSDCGTLLNRYCRPLWHSCKL